MADVMENGTVVAVAANGQGEDAMREISQNGGGGPEESAPAANGGGAGENGEEKLSGRKAKEAERRRRRRTKKKKSGKKEQPAAGGKADQSDSDKENADEAEEKVEVEYVSEKFEVDAYGNMNPLHQDFLEVFEKFALPEQLFSEAAKSLEPDETQADEPKKKGSDDSDDSDDDDDDKDKDKGLSNKKKKLQRRMKIAELKQQCMKPDVVEVWDATAADPRLLVFLKGYRNTVPVPRHWCQKRKFLQGAVHHHV